MEVYATMKDRATSRLRTDEAKYKMVVTFCSVPFTNLLLTDRGIQLGSAFLSRYL